MYQQPILQVSDPQTFNVVKGAIEASFSAGRIAEFLKSLERSKLRIRDFEDVLGKELRGKRPQTTLELAALVLEEAKVAFVPGEAFGTPGYARFSYALADDDMVEGVRRIGELFSETA